MTIDSSGTTYGTRFQNFTGSSDPWLKGTNASGGETFYVNKAGSAYFASDVLFGTADTSPANNSANSTADNGTVIGGGLVMSAAYKSSANAGSVGYFNRTGTDGPIVQLFKSGATVGSIGTTGSNVVIGTGSVGLRFYDGGDAVIPHTAAGGASNGLVDLGQGGFNAFKDLYLSGKSFADTYQFTQNSSAVGATEAIYRPGTGSIAFKANSAERMRIDSSGLVTVKQNLYMESGGIFLGGSGAGNYLDDYEESTYNTVLTGATSGTVTTANSGTMTKIGRAVSITFASDGLQASQVSGNLGIALPVISVAQSFYVPIQVYNANYITDAKTIYGFVASNTSQILLYWSRDNNTSSPVTGAHLNTTSYIRGAFTYPTT
tara:strand:- start:12 stop:1139 length:1128 start_codon:yes stop_codon:yes gene_type:complete